MSRRKKQSCTIFFTHQNRVNGWINFDEIACQLDEVLSLSWGKEEILYLENFLSREIRDREMRYYNLDVLFVHYLQKGEIKMAEELFQGVLIDGITLY